MDREYVTQHSSATIIKPVAEFFSTQNKHIIIHSTFREVKEAVHINNNNNHDRLELSAPLVDRWKLDHDIQAVLSELAVEVNEKAPGEEAWIMIPTDEWNEDETKQYFLFVIYNNQRGFRILNMKYVSLKLLFQPHLLRVTLWAQFEHSDPTIAFDNYTTIRFLHQEDYDAYESICRPIPIVR
jgi:hypothetical protein